MAKKKAIISFSGGLDSTTCLASAYSNDYECYALSFDYGQKHSSELLAAKRIAKHYKVKDHRIISLTGVAQLTRSALTDPQIDIPDFSQNDLIPNTYVPARNTVFLSLAMGWAESIGAAAIFIGVSAIDYSGYPDCRPKFIQAFQDLIQSATDSSSKMQQCKLITPLIQLSKAETIKLGLNLNVDYSMTVSCYKADAKGHACGKCDSCTLRKQGFSAANCPDPTVYACVDVC